MRIDAHVHYMPPITAEALARLTQAEPYWGLLLQPGSVQGWATAEQMLADMDEAGLDAVVLVGEYFQRHSSCVARNNQALALARRWPAQIVALATLQPKAGAPAIDELKRCVDGGLRGVGELNPYAQGYTLDDPDFLRLIEACIDYDLPVNLHVSEEVGPYYPGKSTTPLRHYAWLAETYPELKLILAHWGGGLLFYELMRPVRRQFKNVWYDTAASPLLYPTAKIFGVALQCVAPTKILYGSDYPLRLYPRRQPEPDFQPFLNEIDQLALAPAIAADIMGLNAARLFKLLPPPNGAAPPPAAQATPAATLTGSAAIGWVAHTWPETQPIFEKFGLPWQDSAVPHWEPITQAAAARGWDETARQRLLDTLNAAIQAALD